MAEYRCRVDEDGKATELPLLRVGGSVQQNPHMRGFWGATISFFLAFFGWFAFSPLELQVAQSLGICENQLYPADAFPTRPAYLKYTNLATSEAYCRYGRDFAVGAADCSPVPEAFGELPLCNGTGTDAGLCVTASQLKKYRPEVLAACLCTAGTSCASRLADASTASMASTIVARTGLGFLLERFGPVNVQCGLMAFGALWVAAGGLVRATWSYVLVRFFIGVVGAAFVANQFWNSLMFAPNVVGTANGVSAGWGNLGGGVTTIFMAAALDEPFKRAGVSPDSAWRLALLVPAALMLAAAVGLKALCWDMPTARRLRPADLGKARAAGPWDYLLVLRDVRVVVLIFQYGACFGTELAMLSQLPLHFSSYFQMRPASASAMASIFGLTNIFSRPLGGILSDLMFRQFGMRGRIWLQFVVLLLEATFLFVFGCISSDQPVQGAAVALFLFSVFCEMGCGTSYGIVPFVKPQQMSVVSAVVGAGGNLGAVIATQAFYKPISDDLVPFQAHAAYVLFWALMTPVLFWQQHSGTFPGAKEMDTEERSEETLDQRGESPNSAGHGVVEPAQASASV